MASETSRRVFLKGVAATVGGLGLGVPPQKLVVGWKTNFVPEKDRKPRIRIGCCAYSYRKYLTKGKMTLEEFIQVAADMGLDGIQLTTYYYESTDPAYLHGLKKLAFRNALDIPSIATRTNFCQPDLEKRKQQALEMQKWIDAAVELGATAIRVFGGKIPKGASEDEAVAWTVDGLKRVLPYAERKGVILALENHHGVTATPELVLKIRSQIDSPWFGLLLDTANFMKSSYEGMEKVAPYAVTAHLKTRVYDAEGNEQKADLERIVRIFAKSGYRGYLHIEYEAKEEPRTAIPRIAAQLREIVDRVVSA